MSPCIVFCSCHGFVSFAFLCSNPFMQIALIGYGAMGRLVHHLAEKKEHEIVAIIHESDAGLSSAQLAEKIPDADTAIDFSVPDAVPRNVEACLSAGVPLVEGTTGWNSRIDEIRELVEARGGSFVYGANFSIGVNLFYRIVDNAAGLLSRFDEYETFIEEQHHSRKKDAPSGTALKLKSIVERHVATDFSVSATRAGSIPGTHRVGFDGPADQILLEHTARSREGFASGALLAAEWIINKKGFYEFGDVIEEMLK
jgi:4-hydroxy-tetrahydrodipicolinate reductase